MSESIARLQVRVLADYLNGGHRTWLPGDFAALADLADLLLSYVAQAGASATAASASYALMQALGASAYGVGLSPLSLPRAADLGSNAVRDFEIASGIFTKTVSGTYQATVHDHGQLLISLSGANTITLPLAADVPDGFRFLHHNISGSNLTIQRTGSDTINGAVTTSVIIATGAPIGQVNKRNASTIYHIG